MMKMMITKLLNDYTDVNNNDNNTRNNQSNDRFSF